MADAGTPTPVVVAWLIPAFPLAGAVLLLFFGKRIGKAAGAIASMAMLGSFAMGLATLAHDVQRPIEGRTFVRTLYTWISSGRFSVSIDLRIDPLSIVMVLVVAGVGSLIHLYSLGYMRDDPRYPRYFAYLNLFAASMLLLVLANNFLLLYAAWELVGLGSYLLIGYWFERSAASTAAKKAFITNRVGDVGFLVGILLIFVTFGTGDFGRVLSGAPSMLSSGTATAIALLLLAGAVAKSAQFPLHVWLPDAMEGPTPVSALIHAATMVTAGVYLVARAGPIFSASPVAPDVVAGIGIGTALFAAAVAFAQNDIKRVLAYSTISQLGYMFAAVGVGAAAAGVYHLVSQAFVKALLFLGAGSIMHALSGETDITKMGGLFRRIPWTGVTFIVGWLAIMGFPGTVSFFSKDQILEGASAAGNNVVLALGLVGAAATAFYMSRLTVLAFFGRSRTDPNVKVHESPASMIFPMVALAIAAIAAGWVLGPAGESGRIQRFLTPVLGAQPGASHPSGLSAGTLSGLAIGAALVGVIGAALLYRRGPRALGEEHPSLAWRVAHNGFYLDGAYAFVFAGLGRLGATFLAYVVDARWIDGAINGIGVLVARMAALGRRLQTGFVRSYALGILMGAVFLVAFLLLRTVR